MRSFTVAAMAAAGIALGAAQSASAADIARPVYKAAPVVAAYNWSGLYVGGNVGWAWGEISTLNVGLGASGDTDGFFAGGQIGFNWQAPGSPWVWGIEIDSQWADLKGDMIWLNQAGVIANASARLDYFGTARGRIGYAWDRAMVYFTGGVAWANTSINPTFAIPAVAWGGTSASNSNVGTAVGGGIEWALLDNWSAKVEYLYIDIHQDYFGGPGAGGFKADVDLHTVKVGLNYRFGYSKAPVVAKY